MTDEDRLEAFRLSEALATACSHNRLDVTSDRAQREREPGVFLCLDCNHRVQIVSPDFDSAWFEVIPGRVAVSA